MKENHLPLGFILENLHWTLPADDPPLVAHPWVPSCLKAQPLPEGLPNPLHVGSLHVNLSHHHCSGDRRSLSLDSMPFRSSIVVTYRSPSPSLSRGFQVEGETCVENLRRRSMV
ncbi:unnamed protein product [Victoria cruziana]